MRRMVAGAVAVALLVAGCGGDDGGPDGAIGLLDRLSRGAKPRAVVVDLRVVREKLGISTPDPRIVSGTDAVQRGYSSLYAAAFPLLGRGLDAPVLDAVDLGRVSAAANNGYAGGRDSVTVLATDQPFDEVATRLEADGYVREDSVLRMPNPPRTAAALAATVVAGGAGIIAIGQTDEIVRAAAEGTAPGIHGPARTLIETLSAPAAQAYEFGPDCPKAVAIADDVDDGRARLVIIAEAPRADRLTADDPGTIGFTGMRFEQPSVDADRITAPFTYPRDPTARPPLTILDEAVPTDLYDCG